MYKTITISKDSIESIVEKSDAILIYLKSGKCWVCDEIIPSNDNKVYKFKLKDKCEK